MRLSSAAPEHLLVSGRAAPVAGRPRGPSLAGGMTRREKQRLGPRIARPEDSKSRTARSAEVARARTAAPRAAGGGGAEQGGGGPPRGGPDGSGWVRRR